MSSSSYAFASEKASARRSEVAEQPGGRITLTRPSRLRMKFSSHFRGSMRLRVEQDAPAGPRKAECQQADDLEVPGIGNRAFLQNKRRLIDQQQQDALADLRLQSRGVG